MKTANLFYCQSNLWHFPKTPLASQKSRCDVQSRTSFQPHVYTSGDKGMRQPTQVTKRRKGRWAGSQTRKRYHNTYKLYGGFLAWYIIPNPTNPMWRPETASPSLSKRWGKQVGNILTDHCRRINLETLTVSCYFKRISFYFFFFDVKNNAASRNKLEIGLSFFSPAFKQKCLCSCAAWAGTCKQVEGRTHIVLLSFLQI